MRTPVKEKIEKKPEPKSSIDDRLVELAVKASEDAANSARQTAKLAEKAIESNDLDEMKDALVKMAKAVADLTKAMDKKFTPVRIIPKRENGVATSYDVLPIVKKVH